MESCLKTILILAGICIIIPFFLFFFTSKEFTDIVSPQPDTVVVVETVYIEKKAPKAKKRQTVTKKAETTTTVTETAPKAQKERVNITIEDVTTSAELTTPKQRVKGRQYIEVRGPRGDVELYNGMPKEEVRQLLGKPDKSDMMEILGDIHETWKYQSNGMLYIMFENGKLTSVNSY